MYYKLSTMESEEIKLDLIHWLSETNDLAALKKIQKIRYSTSVLTPEQDAILEERMKKYESGLMKFSSWDDVMKRITAIK